MIMSQEHLYSQFKMVFHTYYNSLCNYAFTFVKEEDVSEDIVQEVFMRVWEGRRELLLEDSVRYYLFTAVRNNSITHLRQKKNSAVTTWNGEEIMNEPAPERKEAEPDQRLLLQKAIGQLPPKCREVFLLSRLSGLTYKEIASSLGISVKTVENQLGKALKILRVFLREKGVYLVSFFL